MPRSRSMSMCGTFDCKHARLHGHRWLLLRLPLNLNIPNHKYSPSQTIVALCRNVKFVVGHVKWIEARNTSGQPWCKWGNTWHIKLRRFDVLRFEPIIAREKNRFASNSSCSCHEVSYCDLHRVIERVPSAHRRPGCVMIHRSSVGYDKPQRYRIYHRASWMWLFLDTRVVARWRNHPVVSAVWMRWPWTQHPAGQTTWNALHSRLRHIHRPLLRRDILIERWLFWYKNTPQFIIVVIVVVAIVFILVANKTSSTRNHGSMTATSRTRNYHQSSWQERI